MTTATAKWLARRLMVAHGLGGWKLKLVYSKSRKGECVDDEQLLRLSSAWIKVDDDEEVFRTILHEIAHGVRTYDKDAAVDDLEPHSKQWWKAYRKLCYIYGIKPECG